ncbi:uncharacterized protein LOC105384200 isoform X1 [Plutella xylostella]|uniref:uncharacterized protein LOC105384200 isoform X1 n=1 Tax=Plutella xylostella TaxID=51655 RepID=UPI002032BB6F|nr:uncharacterized protein LOC105384200 isoform X1 [Plutella xylostella]
MSHMKIALVVCCCAALVAAQYEHYGLDFSNSFLATSFGAAPSFNTLSAAGARDPRANTGNLGPVVFPPSPAGDPGQTSGVVPGASGYGFVPPGSQGPAVPNFYYRGFFLR